MDEMAPLGKATQKPAPQGRRPANDPPWLRRLWANQRVPLPPDRLHWWSVHVQRFLSYVRSHQLQGPVGVLASQFLADLGVRQPPASDWHRDQVRQALEVFERGICHWHFEADETGRMKASFRLKPVSTPDVPVQVRISVFLPGRSEEGGSSGSLLTREGWVALGRDVPAGVAGGW